MTGTDIPEGDFLVLVEPSGRRFGANCTETVLNAGVRQGITLPYGCKDGACGSCKCRLVSGHVQLAAHQSSALSAQEQAAGLILTCCARAQSDLVLESRQVSAADALPVRKMPVRVRTITRKSDDVLVLSLQLPASEPFVYHAGQYVEFLLRDGSRRSYSMANAAHNGPGLELHIRHLPGGKFTDHVFGALQERDVLRIEGPFGSFYLREDSAKPIILLASGTGFAPLKALIEHMAHRGITRPSYLYWGGRRPADLYLQDWIRAQQAVMPQLHYVPVVSDALAEDQWQGRSGYVHHAVLQDHPDLSGFQVYVCGVPVMVHAARSDFTQRAGLDEAEFFADAFTSEADKAN